MPFTQDDKDLAIQTIERLDPFDLGSGHCFSFGTSETAVAKPVCALGHIYTALRRHFYSAPQPMLHTYEYGKYMGLSFQETRDIASANDFVRDGELSLRKERVLKALKDIPVVDRHSN